MSDSKLTIEQKIQIARMSADIVVAAIRMKQDPTRFTNESLAPRTDHDLFEFTYGMIMRKVTTESDNC